MPYRRGLSSCFRAFISFPCTSPSPASSQLRGQRHSGRRSSTSRPSAPVYRQISPFLIFIFTDRSHFFRIFLRSDLMTKQTKPVQIGLVCFAFTCRRRTLHLHDGFLGIAQGCRPGNEGKTPLSPAHLMQKRALIAMQYSALHHRTWKTPTVQKPCRNRAPMAYKTKKP